MIRKIFLYKSTVLLIIFAAIFSLVSCTPQLKPSTDAAKNDEQNEPPKELEELRKSIEEVEKTLMFMYEEKKKAQQGIISSGSEVSKNEHQQGGEQSRQQGNQQQSQGEIKIEMKPEELAEFSKQQQLAKDQEELAKKQKETLEKFEDLKKKVIELHEKWNSYEPKAIKALAQAKSIEEFEKNLDNLTNTIQTRDEYKTLLDVNSLLKTLPDFYELYTTKVPPDLDRLKYSIKKVKLFAEKDDYNSMKPAMEYLINIWSSAKPKLKKDVTEQMTKFEFALNDLKNAVENKNKIVIDAKSEVLTKIIDEMVEKLKS
ncbi:hypothetical protein [Lutispora thermophila]|uniref:Uncharacterized protein n=1 Tax=Lutispora thermophila DSM 19022 TaxID=1122184 RepID=A0A1M6EXB4_9FIRM|nr:hypothetical protein [Lutispora thermophila]SHI90085.1 hypothetical protein SAMN02745176_01754 [Lutispora thermophila DSM 19022]